MKKKQVYNKINIITFFSRKLKSSKRSVLPEKHCIIHPFTVHLFSRAALNKNLGMPIHLQRFTVSVPFIRHALVKD